MRLFVAVYPPREVVARLQEMLGGLGLPGHRLTAVDQVHVTMLFLGERRPSTLADIEESVEASCKGVRACMVRPVRLIALPERGEARLVAAETDAPPSLTEVQKRLVQRLAAREKRRGAFLPHLTLCRFAGGGAGGTLELQREARAIENPSSLAFELKEVHLVKSVLHPLGARHETVRVFAMG